MLTRRTLLADFGKGTLAALVLAACVSDPVSNTSAGARPDTTDPPAPGTTDGSSVTATTAAGVTSDLRWERVSLGSVSAYILARSGEATLVDTGVSGSSGAIEAALVAMGLDWGAVGHVIATHKHPDHVGSLEAVLDAAEGATGYAGAEDIPAMVSARPLVAVGDGDSVFGLTIIGSPGHTPGHVSVLDPGRLLVAGDALNGDAGGVVGPNPRFTEDIDLANASVKRLAEFEYEVALFGHGDPVTSGASGLVSQLAAGL